MYKLISQNRKAFYNYEIIEKLEAGIVLIGAEVKSLRLGKVSINEAYIESSKSSYELFVTNMHIGKYEFAQLNTTNFMEKRPRKLLLNKKQLVKINNSITRKGYTSIPLKIYFNKNGFIKVEIGLAKGKKEFNKKQAIKEKDIKKEQDRFLKNYKYKNKL